MDTYYKPEDLSKFEEIGKEALGFAKKCFDDYGAVFAEGEPTERAKALIGLAVPHTVQPPYCIDAFTGTHLEKGPTPGDMTEAVHGVTATRRGASLVYGLKICSLIEKPST